MHRHPKAISMGAGMVVFIYKNPSLIFEMQSCRALDETKIQTHGSFPNVVEVDRTFFLKVIHNQA